MRHYHITLRNTLTTYIKRFILRIRITHLFTALMGYGRSRLTAAWTNRRLGVTDNENRNEIDADIAENYDMGMSKDFWKDQHNYVKRNSNKLYR